MAHRKLPPVHPGEILLEEFRILISLARTMSL